MNEREKRFSMVLGNNVTCCSCTTPLPRGTLCRMRPLPPPSPGFQAQCGHCAAIELLPLFEAEDRAARERVAAEEAVAA